MGVEAGAPPQAAAAARAMIDAVILHLTAPIVPHSGAGRAARLLAPMPVLKRVAPAVLFLTAMVACWGGDAGDGAIGVARGFNVTRFSVAEREPAPSFSGELLSVVRGDRASQDLYAGKVAVVNFWGSWCGPCRLEQPHLNVLWDRFRKRGVFFLGVNVRDPKANALSYRDEFRVPYPSVYSPDAGVSYSFVVRLMPTTFVIDRKGRIAARVIGAIREPQDLAGPLGAVLEGA